MISDFDKKAIVRAVNVVFADAAALMMVISSNGVRMNAREMLIDMGVDVNDDEIKAELDRVIAEKAKQLNNGLVNGSKML